MYKIKEIPINERPREKLISNGVERLSDIELLAIILRTGNKDESALDLARKIIFSNSSLSDLQHITYNELLTFKGIGNSKATLIISMIEFCRRMYISKGNKRQIKSAQDVFDYLKYETCNLKQEHLYVILLDTKSQIISHKAIFIGTLNKSVIHQREVFNYAIKNMAAAILIAHNHPSGNPNPSLSDIEVTNILYKASQVIGIEVIDHVILGDSFYSLKEHGDF